MGIPQENEERLIDRLLRAEFRRSITESACEGLDPNLAAAYIEKLLPASEAGEFEGHLAQCAPCRTGVARLVLLESADARPEVASNARARASTTPTMLQRVLAALAQPKWALAATAVVALAVAIPVLLRSRQNDAVPGQQANLPAAEAPQATVARNDPPADLYARLSQQRMAEERADSQASSRGRAGEAVDALRTADDSRKQAETATATTEDSSFRAAGAPEPKRADAQPAQPESERAEATQEKNREVAAAPPAPKEEKKKLGPIDETLTISEDRSKADSKLLKPGSLSDQRDSSDKDRSAAIKSEVVARAPETSGEGGGKVVAKRPETRARKQSEKDTEFSSYAAIGARSKPEGTKEVGKKTFHLIDGIWTDEDYNHSKQIPGVTLIRDSDLYKEAVAKDAALKALLDKFGADDTVVVVHKRTAYKITPRKQN